MQVRELKSWIENRFGMMNYFQDDNESYHLGDKKISSGKANKINDIGQRNLRTESN